jgi:hypothetical protein
VGIAARHAPTSPTGALSGLGFRSALDRLQPQDSLARVAVVLLTDARSMSILRPRSGETRRLRLGGRLRATPSTSLLPTLPSQVHRLVLSHVEHVAALSTIVEADRDTSRFAGLDFFAAQVAHEHRFLCQCSPPCRLDLRILRIKRISASRPTRQPRCPLPFATWRCGRLCRE